MYVDASTVRRGNKTYTRYLLRESFREAGKVKHRTIANLSQCSAPEIEAIRLALTHKHTLTDLGSIHDAVQLRQGASVGAVALLYALAQQIGLTQALGPGREASLALWQVIARVIDQGSRLSAVRLARHHGAQELLGLARFDEDDLYANLDWLCENQPRIEQRLFDQHSRQDHGGLFLYDVTSSYLEGEHNELAAFGYNRDGKRGKRQIVIGLLCDAQGTPLCIEVFEGNTQDPKTFVPQVKKVAARFGAQDVTFVGDRGMIKSAQIEALGERGFHYITAITKPQIERLLKQGTFQIGLFDDALAEVQEHGGVRYVLRRNAQRAQEMADTRQDKYRVLAQAVKIQNGYLAEHKRAKPEVALRKLQAHAHKLGVNSWLSFGQQERILSLVEDSEVLAELSRLDGCYALKTDLPLASAAKELVHARYKDLAQVEWAFRCAKTVHLDMRPIFVRRASRTRGHALVVMLAYRLIQELASRWSALDLTVQEGIDMLASLCLVEVQVNGQVPFNQIPQPSQAIQSLLDAACVRLPSALPGKKGSVSTKAKLQNRRKRK
jgi:Transposase DDE domain